MPQLTVCPSCAEHLEPEDRFCGNCGTAVAAAATADPREEVRESAATTPRGDYGLAPPVPWPGTGRTTATRPPAGQAPAPPPQNGRPPRQGIADPRREMQLLTEPEPDAPEESASARRPPAPRAQPPALAPAPEASARQAPARVDGPAATCVACREDVIGADGRCVRCGHAGRERDHVERELAAIAAASDLGLRHHRNEDAFAVAEAAAPDGTPALIAVVCDGVSSASRSDEASAAAAEAAGGALATALGDGAEPRRAMHDALLSAADAVNALSPPQAERDPHHNAPACTCVSAVITGDLLTVGWIGDSRAYWIPEDRAGEQPSRLTEDDSWAARMVEAGLMSEEDAYADARAHAITGWLGADAVELDPHTASYQLEAPGVVVVCTDGLWNYAESAEQLAAVVPPDARERPLRCARALLEVALEGGGHDNVTVAVLPFPVPASGAQSA